jgi:hypothetical protein
MQKRRNTKRVVAREKSAEMVNAKRVDAERMAGCGIFG